MNQRKIKTNILNNVNRRTCALKQIISRDETNMTVFCQQIAVLAYIYNYPDALLMLMLMLT